MSNIRTNDDNPIIKFILDNQEAVRIFLHKFIDICADGAKIQIDKYLTDLEIQNRGYKSNQ